MSPRHATAAALLALLTAAGGALPAHAQATVESGIKVGAARLRPGLELGWGYDSAVGYFPTSPAAASNGLAPEWVARIAPSLGAVLSTPIADLSGNARLDFVWFTGLLSPGSQAASRLQGELDLSARFNPNGPFGFLVQERLTRSDRTSNVGAGLGVLSLRNDIRLSAPMKPGGGALEITPAAIYAVELFSPVVNQDIPGCTDPSVCTAAGVAQGNFHNLRGELTSSYRFLPRTSLVLDAGYDARMYFTAATNRNTNLLRATLGLAGLVLPRFSGLLKLGWGQDFAGSTMSVIGQAEVTYHVNTRSLARAGYMRNVEPMPIYGVMVDDRGYIAATYHVGEKLVLTGTLSLDYLSFEAPARRDLVFAFSPTADYTVTRWLKAGLQYGFSARSSSASTLATLNLARHDLALRFTFAF
ncbi:MAG: hypothetical protein RL653_1514 [Pseudomonadota bacterium]|jgi:hypothetical protein